MEGVWRVSRGSLEQSSPGQEGGGEGGPGREEGGAPGPPGGTLNYTDNVENLFSPSYSFLDFLSLPRATNVKGAGLHLSAPYCTALHCGSLHLLAVGQ